MANDEHKAIHSVLSLLLDGGDLSTRRDNLATISVLEAARGQCVPIKKNELDSSLLYRTRGQLPEGRAIYLRPPPQEKAAVAAVWCRWDFEAPISSCGFYYGNWSRQQAVGRDDVAFVGFRYETPEMGDNHDYYHAQPCRSMGFDRLPVTNSLPISVRYPTFPLLATSSLELLLCLVISIYGVRGLRQLEADLLAGYTTRRNTLLLQSLRSFKKVVARSGSEGCNR